MKAKFLAAPWVATLDGVQGNTYWRAVQIHAGEFLVARVQAVNAAGEGDAIVSVIAAAPDMLVALVNAGAAIATCMEHGNPSSEMQAALRDVRAVIAKALPA